MLGCRRNKGAATLAFVIFMIAGVLSLSSALSYEDKSPGPEASHFDRADVGTIRAYTHEILSDPDFAPETTFWQWLMGKFSKWRGPKLNLGPGWTAFLLWLLFIWCVLTLVAILIHLVWTVCLLVWSNRGSKTVPNGSGGSKKGASFEELYRMTRELAEKGAFSEAISMMIAALLRWLDYKKVVRFHESKTNGDYIREYPSGYVEQNEFRAFVVMFEKTVYGGLRGNDRTYEQMNSLMEHIRSCVIQRT